MLDFLFLFKKNSNIGELLEYFSSDRVPELTFLPKSSLKLGYQTKGRYCFFWSTEDDILDGSLLKKEEGYLGFEGYAFAKSFITKASQLEKNTIPNVFSGAIDGQFGIFQISKDEFIICSDYLGQYILFLTENNKFAAISNNPHLLARALAGPNGELSKDHMMMGWHPLCDMIFDSSLPSGYTGVNVAEPEYAFVLNEQNYIIKKKIDLDRRFIVDGDYEHCLDKLYAIFHHNVSCLMNDPTSSKKSHLTGGMDTRLVLSFLIDIGKEKEVLFKTSGYDEHPDVIVSKLIASSFNLNYGVDTPSDKIPDVKVVDSKLKEHCLVTGGLVSHLNTTGLSVKDTSVIALTGAGVETIRSPYGIRIEQIANQYSPMKNNLSIIRNRFFNTDCLKLLTPPSKNHYIKKFDETFDIYYKQFNNPIDAVDCFFHRLRLRQFQTGIRSRFNTNVAPLVSNFCPELAFRFGFDLRLMENVYFRLMRKASLPLTKIPYAKKRWKEANYAQLPDKEDYENIQIIKGVELLERDKRFPIYYEIFQRYIECVPDQFYEVYDKKGTTDLFSRDVESFTQNEKNVAYRVGGSAVWASKWESELFNMKLKIK
jgi:hypothetical protein